MCIYIYIYIYIYPRYHSYKLLYVVETREAAHEGKRERKRLGVRSMKQEVLELEESIPWTCVRKSWRNKRAAWKRQIRQVELVAGFAAKLKELRQALMIEDTALIGCGPSWRRQLDTCIQGRGSAAQLAAVWDEMKKTVTTWLYGPSSQNIECDSLPATAALRAMNDALKSGYSDVLQVPIESIVRTDTGRLLGIREAVELERQRIISKFRGEEDIGRLARLNQAFQESDFDSGADTEQDAMTDVDSMYDP